MSTEQDKVLTMLEEGAISAEEANDLLTAMPADTEDEMVITAVSAASGDIPDMDRYRNFWLAPFLILSTVTAILGLMLRSAMNKRKPFGFLFALALFSFSFILTVLMFLSRNSTWVHIRIQEKEGPKIAISLPLPLSMAARFIEFARQYSPPEAQDNLEMAAAAIAAAQESFQDPDADPIVINVDDEDARVQVFIG